MNHKLGPQASLVLREAQQLLATIDSWGGTIHESHLAGLRAAVRQVQDAREGTLTLLEQTIAPRTQSVVLTATYATPCGRKLRVRIESDAYDFQSTARISMLSLNDGKWPLLASIPFSRMRTPHGLFSRPAGEGLKPELFEADRADLLSQACALLDIPGSAK